MSRDKAEKGAGLCPVGRFFSELERRAGTESRFFEHLGKSRIEFLKAVRALVDERIEAIEKKGAAKGGRRRTRIEVE
jgi:hypothetical protein